VIRPLLLRRVAVATLLAVLALFIWAVSLTSHLWAAEAGTFSCSHASQSIHEIPAPASWPGTRAAHVVSTFSGGKQQLVYTKSGWWDPTWDYYYSSTKTCV
jgi:hypothetical protein